MQEYVYTVQRALYQSNARLRLRFIVDQIRILIPLTNQTRIILFLITEWVLIQPIHTLCLNEKGKESRKFSSFFPDPAKISRSGSVILLCTILVYLYNVYIFHVNIRSRVNDKLKKQVIFTWKLELISQDSQTVGQIGQKIWKWI